MKPFNACKGKQYCLEDPNGCKTCGRSHAEIARTRELIAQIADAIAALGYSNPEAFSEYLAAKAVKKYRYDKAQQTDTGNSPAKATG